MIDLEKRRPVFNNTFAGLSGPAVRPIALRMVWQAVGAVSIPVVGLGGILTGKDALEFIMAGAAAVQVGTANFLDRRPAPASRTRSASGWTHTALRRWMRSEGAHGKSPAAFPSSARSRAITASPASSVGGRAADSFPRGGSPRHIHFACIFIQNMLL